MMLGIDVGRAVVLMVFVIRLLAILASILVKGILAEIVLGLVSNATADANATFVVVMTVDVVTVVVEVTVTISIVNISVTFIDRIQSTK